MHVFALPRFKIDWKIGWIFKSIIITFPDVWSIIVTDILFALSKIEVPRDVRNSKGPET